MYCILLKQNLSSTFPHKVLLRFPKVFVRGMDFRIRLLRILFEKNLRKILGRIRLLRIRFNLMRLRFRIRIRTRLQSAPVNLGPIFTQIGRRPRRSRIRSV